MEKAASFNGLTVISGTDSILPIKHKRHNLCVSLYHAQNRHLKLFYQAMYLQLQGLKAVTK